MNPRSWLVLAWLVICALDVAWLVTVLTAFGVRRLLTGCRFRRRRRAVLAEADALLIEATLAHLVSLPDVSEGGS